MKFRYIIFALVAAIACSAQTPTQKSRPDIYTEIDALFPDNESEEITPADLRTVAKNQAASFHNTLTDGAPLIRTANLGDVQDKAAAFAAIKQAASTAVSGAVVFATDGEIAALKAVQANDARLSNARPPTAHTHPATEISDATAVGRSVVTAATAAAARTAIGAGTSSFSGAYNDLTGKPTLGTAAALDVPAIGNAAVGEIVKGNDTRLSDARTPATHSHPATDISDATAVGRSVVTAATAAAARTAIGAGTSSFSGAYSDLTGKPTLGTAAALDVPAIGNAAAGEIVKGSDTRLSDARTPTAHTHAATEISDSTAVGRSVVTAATAAAARTAIGAGTSNFDGAYGSLSGTPSTFAPSAHASSHASAGSDPLTIAQSQVVNLTTDLAAKVPTSRSVATQHSLTGGGDMTGDRTISLVNDTASPGANKVYGTDAGGVRGWKNDPAGGPGGWTSGLLTSTVSSVSNTTTETSVMTCTIPGGTLGTAGAVRCVLFGQWTNNSGGSANLTIKIRYGGTTIYHDGSNSATSHGNPRPFTVAFILAANGATGSQRLLGELLYMGPVQATTAGYGSWSSGSLSFVGGFGNTSISVDSTVDQTLEILVTMSSATSTTFTALRAPVVKL